MTKRGLIGSNQQTIDIIIESPKGSRNKYKFDPKRKLFTLSRVLPEGMSYPLDYGFVPLTAAEDGDPLDAFVLTDEPTFPGCVVETRLIGVFEGQQQEKGKTFRNDRLVGVATQARRFAQIHELDELNSDFLEQLEVFLENNHQGDAKKFKTLRRSGPKSAWTLLKEARTSKKAV